MLIAQPHSRGDECVYPFDIVQQGDDETPFFNL